MNHLTILEDVGLGIIFAAAMSHVARLLKQPLILGYVVGGVILGTHLGLGLVHDAEDIELISEIGLILLLFIIGLEIDLRELAKMGKPVFVLGFFQFLGCVLLGLGFFYPLGYRIGGGNFDLLYIAVALGLSSTLIVVKLLNDKFETRTIAGRVTIGVLVLQDFWAIAFMAFQPNLLSPAIMPIVKSFASGIGIVVGALVISRWVLSKLFHVAGKQPELVLLTATAWCFLVCGVAEHAGLSKEMGALIAGMSIVSFPYGTDVIAKLAGVRDFFVTLFFVSLGLKVPLPTPAVLGMASLMVAFVFFSRIFAVVTWAPLVGMGLRNGFVTAVNLAQISEFSLVILALGAGYGHVSPELQSLVLTAMILASVTSTYLIMFNDKIARGGVRFLVWLGVREKEMHEDTDRHDGKRRDVVLLGCFREGTALLERINNDGGDLKDRVLVVDYNPALRQKLESRGYRWVYGDLAYPESLHHIGIEEASFIICSISDTFLKGITNLQLLTHLKHMAPKAKIVMTADEPKQAVDLKAAGAHDAVIPGHLAGAYLYDVLTDAVAAPKH